MDADEILVSSIYEYEFNLVLLSNDSNVSNRLTSLDFLWMRVLAFCILFDNSYVFIEKFE